MAVYSFHGTFNIFVYSFHVTFNMAGAHVMMLCYCYFSDKQLRGCIRIYKRLMSSVISIECIIAEVSMFNRMSYLRSNILYIKWKYDVDITTTNIKQ